MSVSSHKIKKSQEASMWNLIIRNIIIIIIFFFFYSIDEKLYLNISLYFIYKNI